MNPLRLICIPILVALLAVAAFVTQTQLAAASGSQAAVPPVGTPGLANQMIPPLRVPAEWEPHKATWMQWPKFLESSYRQNFSDIIDALQQYEPVNILVGSYRAQGRAKNFLKNRGVPLTNIKWHVMKYDWAWMRDNGPVWVEAGGNTLFVEDWGFDAWGGVVPYWAWDNSVPPRIAAAEGLFCADCNLLINERGNLEFNGVDTLITSWPCMTDRNPGWSKSQMEMAFGRGFGVTKVVWLESAPAGDLTKGHVDGIARFIDPDTVAVARYVNQSDPDAQVYEEAATIIGNAGLNVVRLDVPGKVTYKGIQMSAIYTNWLVANGAVILCGFGVPAWDNAAKATVAGYFPGRDVVVVETLELWYSGGGVHCVTNDQPAR
jgi:agmatine deiminase